MSEPGEEPPAPNPRAPGTRDPCGWSERHPDSAELARRTGGTGTLGPENARTQSHGTLGSPSPPPLRLCPQGSSKATPTPRGSRPLGS